MRNIICEFGGEGLKPRRPTGKIGHRGKIHCPKCEQALEVYVDAEESVGFCGVCGVMFRYELEDVESVWG